jgi:DNA-binding NarL/FixJ family response regulator
MSEYAMPDDNFSASGERIVLVEGRSLNRRLLSDWLLAVWPGCEIDAVVGAAQLSAIGNGRGRIRLAIHSLGNGSVRTPQVTADIQMLLGRIGRAPLIMLGDREDRVEVAAALTLGARGFVPTSFDEPTAVRAIEFVLAGGTFAPANAVANGVGDSGNGAAARQTSGNGVASLTPRERDVAAGVCAGKPNKIIAHELQISEATVKVFVRNILTKLGASNRTEAASAIRHELDTPAVAGAATQGIGTSKRTGTASRTA